MKNQSTLQNYESSKETKVLHEDTFTGIESMVEAILTSLDQNRKTKKKSKTGISKKWHKPKKQKRKVEEIGMIDLPFTF